MKRNKAVQAPRPKAKRVDAIISIWGVDGQIITLSLPRRVANHKPTINMQLTAKHGRAPARIEFMDSYPLSESDWRTRFNQLSARHERSRNATGGRMDDGRSDPAGGM